MKKINLLGTGALLLMFGLSACSSSSDSGSKFYGGELAINGVEDGLLELQSGLTTELEYLISPNVGSSKNDYTKFELRMVDEDAINPNKKYVFKTDNPNRVIGMVNGEARLYLFASSHLTDQDYIAASYNVKVVGQKYVTSLQLAGNSESLTLFLNNEAGKPQVSTEYIFSDSDYSVLPDEATVKDVELRVQGEGNEFVGIKSGNILYGKAEGAALVEVIAIGAERIDNNVKKTIKVEVKNNN